MEPIDFLADPPKYIPDPPQTDVIEDMTLSDFMALPHKEWSGNSTTEEYDSFIIIPGNEEDLHDSGFRNMEIVACRKNKAIVRLAGGSDVLHIGGIGGDHHFHDLSVDSLPKSGFLRVFSSRNRMIMGPALSSFEIKRGSERHD